MVSDDGSSKNHTMQCSDPSQKSQSLQDLRISCIGSLSYVIAIANNWTGYMNLGGWEISRSCWHSILNLRIYSRQVPTSTFQSGISGVMHTNLSNPIRDFICVFFCYLFQTLHLCFFTA